MTVVVSKEKVQSSQFALFLRLEPAADIFSVEEVAFIHFN